jgi:hypothetical protein
MLGSPIVVPAQPACTQTALPAYSHNDYERQHPLLDALAHGYRGVEVDIFHVDGVLRVGHDRRTARGGGSFEALYLAPLVERIERCGRLTREGEPPFLLALEIKERSPETYEALRPLLVRYATLFVAPTGLRAPVEIVMVGWRPAGDDRAPIGGVASQHRIARESDTLVADPEGRVRLLSLDYGKTMGRFWVGGGARRRWLRTLSAAKRVSPGRLLRVHNAPVDGPTYAALLAAGVDLIGTKRLDESRRTLERLAR